MANNDMKDKRKLHFENEKANFNEKKKLAN
jgi:hypothetical protein